MVNARATAFRFGASSVALTIAYWSFWLGVGRMAPSVYRYIVLLCPLVVVIASALSGAAGIWSPRWLWALGGPILTLILMEYLLFLRCW